MQGPQLQALLLKTGADAVVFDIQDVGTRFYTFIWCCSPALPLKQEFSCEYDIISPRRSLWDVMSVASAAGIKEIIVLDRPNPIGGRVRPPSPLLPT